ncbi:hypothetical protein B0O80DRAFT_448266 [Mortierella sp. GBAus27b]|nr:hypothetical protein B0O80DRAFT_448266 [Mortierella sp. GBAus27b]
MLAPCLVCSLSPQIFLDLSLSSLPLSLMTLLPSILPSIHPFKTSYPSPTRNTLSTRVLSRLYLILVAQWVSFVLLTITITTTCHLNGQRHPHTRAHIRDRLIWMMIHGSPFHV